MGVCERRNSGGKSFCSVLPVDRVVLKEATAAALMLSLPFITGGYDSFALFITVFTKLAGSTDYVLALYKICYVLCSVRFVMQETTEPPMFRKLYHMSMEIFFL